MKYILLFCAAWLLPVAARSAPVTTNLTAETILARVWSNRPMRELSLKARLAVTRDQLVNVQAFIKNTPDEMRAIYRSDAAELLVVQPQTGNARFYLQGTGELTGDQLLGKFLGSQFSYYDLGTAFLHWPATKLIGENSVRGQKCLVIECTATNQPYARVKAFIHKEYAGLLRAEAYDAESNLVKRVSITSFKRIGDLWIPHGIEIGWRPPGQSLPAEEKSRLEFFEGDYNAKLPEDLFLADRFRAAGK
jgi:hypothetical protein